VLINIQTGTQVHYDICETKKCKCQIQYWGADSRLSIPTGFFLITGIWQHWTQLRQVKNGNELGCRFIFNKKKFSLYMCLCLLWARRSLCPMIKISIWTCIHCKNKTYKSNVVCTRVSNIAFIRPNDCKLSFWGK